MVTANPLVQSDSERTFETAKDIEITKHTVKFGSSVYQFKNVTGFKVGEIPKENFPLQTVLLLTVGGVLTAAFIIGIFLLIGAISLVVKYFTQSPSYGLILYLNSGQQRIFVSSDKNFLMEIVDTLFKFMETPIDGSVHIDMSNRSISVGGDFHGVGITGNRNTMQ